MDLRQYLLCCLFLAIAVLEAGCVNVSIIGGDEVKKVQPWMVSIQKNGRHVCGGILIRDQWLLTAAHCKQEPKDSVTVVVGTLSLSKGSDRVGILSYEHPKTFNARTKQDDIMLIKLKKKVKAKPKNFPKKEQEIPPGTKCAVMGWGTSRANVMEPSDKLQSLEVTVMDRDLCNCYYKGDPVVTKDMMCASYKPGKKGTCLGDSGGPLQCKKNIVGVVSGARGCGNPKMPTVYTFLSKRNIFWINSKLKKQFNDTTF